MIKSLTEKWKDREIEQALYYVRSNYNNIFVGLPYGINMMRVIDNGCFDVDSVKEVLAPVPSYEKVKHWDECANKIMDEVEKLQKQLAIATNAISNIEDGYSENTGAGQIARQALKEMEGVK